jgi:hypothetical protein
MALAGKALSWAGGAPALAVLDVAESPDEVWVLTAPDPAAPAATRSVGDWFWVA